MKLPQHLKAVNAFINGNNQYGVLMDISRPKIQRDIENYKPGGMMGELGVAHGYKKLEMELTTKGYDSDILRSMDIRSGATIIRYQAALQQEDGNSYQTLQGEARGRIIEYDPGTDKQGESGESKFKMELIYWRESLNGKDILEIDVYGNKAAFDGKDERVGLRAALGL
jgi:phage contractile tail tube protein, P2 family|nr:MAG TPA: FIIR2 tail protein [Caudoviricetes sp.]